MVAYNSRQDSISNDFDGDILDLEFLKKNRHPVDDLPKIKLKMKPKALLKTKLMNFPNPVMQNDWNEKSVFETRHSLSNLPRAPLKRCLQIRGVYKS